MDQGASSSAAVEVDVYKTTFKLVLTGFSVYHTISRTRWGSVVPYHWASDQN